jgi:hypothetical protein
MGITPQSPIALHWLKVCVSTKNEGVAHDLILRHNYTFAEDDIGILKHLRVYWLADMLGTDALKTLAMEKAKAALEKNWVQADFSETVREVYSNTMPSDILIRGLMIETAKRHMGVLKTDQGFKDVLMEFGEFSGALILSDGTSPSKCKYCNRSPIYCQSCGNAQI